MIMSNDVVEKINGCIENGKRKFVIYPYGKCGKEVAAGLVEHFGVEPILLVDNKSGEEGCINLEALKKRGICEDEIVLFCSYNSEIYDELKEEIYDKVDKKDVIELYEKIDMAGIEYADFLAESRRFDRNNNILYIEDYDTYFFLPCYRKDILQKKILRFNNFYEDEYLHFITKVFHGGINLRGKTVLDIGANIGNHSLYFAKLAGAAKIYSFEPVKDTYEMLRKNIEINSLMNTIIPFNVGVGETDSRGKILVYHEDNIGGTHITEDENGNIEIRSIDGMAIEEEIALMKIDVEGFELHVIKGAIETIKRYKPLLVVEVLRTSGNFVQVATILSGLGYKWREIYPENYIFYM